MKKLLIIFMFLSMQTISQVKVGYMVAIERCCLDITKTEDIHLAQAKLDEFKVSTINLVDLSKTTRFLFLDDGYRTFYFEVKKINKRGKYKNFTQKEWEAYTNAILAPKENLSTINK